MFQIILGTLFGNLQINSMLTKTLNCKTRTKKEKEVYIIYVYFTVSQASKHYNDLH